jgi:hypothetical protein
MNFAVAETAGLRLTARGKTWHRRFFRVCDFLIRHYSLAARAEWNEDFRGIAD